METGGLTFLVYCTRQSSVNSQNLDVNFMKQLMQKELALCLFGSDRSLLPVLSMLSLETQFKWVHMKSDLI